MNLPLIAFYAFAAILLLAAMRVVTARNPVYAALFLVLAFFSAACVWMLLRAEFLAITLVLVYVGAVMVLFLFVVMMLDLKEEERRKVKKLGLIAGLVSVGAIVTIFVRSLLATNPGKDLPAPTKVGDTATLGKMLFTNYLLPFEIVSILLLVAMVGVILLSKKDLK